MVRNKKNGFTLVELLAVIVILAIILVIAVPKVMSIIEDAKMGTLESTAKMIASNAEKQKVQNTVLGNNKEITCDSVAKINDVDYANCDIEFENNTAKVTIEGSGKFDNLWVCDGTKTSATAQNESCGPQIQVKHPLFLSGQQLTPNKFEVTMIDSDGNTRVLENGTSTRIAEEEAITITSPNWPKNYPNTNTSNYWEQTYNGAKAIQITFDEASELAASDYCSDYIEIYDKNNNRIHVLDGNIMSGNSYIVYGDYIKVSMITQVNSQIDSWSNPSGFSAIIKPIYYVNSEFTVNPTVAPNTNGKFDITITINDESISKKVTTSISKQRIIDYVESHKGFDTVQTNATYNGTTYDSGIRYVGDQAEVKNKVYYNCESTDSAGVSYGENNYNYAGSCEVWRIIGVFDTKPSTSGIAEKRVKLINTTSTFYASWDSSACGVNGCDGINQWGESGEYKGADLMQLLNGYYIGTKNSTCTYCNKSGKETCSETCTTESLSSTNMKPLTAKAKSMIGNAVWDTYGVKSPDDGVKDVTWAPTAYLEEKGISQQYTGKSLCEGENHSNCNDEVTRTTSWTGLVGLMSVSDIIYADGWLYKIKGYDRWLITPYISSWDASRVWSNSRGYQNAYYSANMVSPSVYLKSDINVISGNGDDKPYILSVQ